MIIKKKCIIKTHFLVSSSVVKGKLYLFGGSSHPEAKQCLPGVYCFDIGETLDLLLCKCVWLYDESEQLVLLSSCWFVLSVMLTWEKLLTGGVCLRSLRHSTAALGENIYVYGGILDGVPTDDLMMFNTGQYCEDRIRHWTALLDVLTIALNKLTIQRPLNDQNVADKPVSHTHTHTHTHTIYCMPSVVWLTVKRVKGILVQLYTFSFNTFSSSFICLSSVKSWLIFIK